MKKDITDFVAQCDTCRRIKVEHQHPAILLQPLDMWKWVKISMDFIGRLSRSPKGNDAIVDRLTKSAHFILVKATYDTHQLAWLYVLHILNLLGTPLSIL